MDKLDEVGYFSSSVYLVKKPEFLDVVREVALRNFEDGQRTSIHDVQMGGNMSDDVDVQPFAQYVSQTAWNILNSQGYNMTPLVTFFSEMWMQRHNQNSGMEQHFHSQSQITAFYFLSVPEGGCQMVLHDPRHAKVYAGIGDADPSKFTPASNMVLFTFEAGDLVLTNSWLPHSFTRNSSSNPTDFIHMNLGVMANPNPPQQAEVI